MATFTNATRESAALNVTGLGAYISLHTAGRAALDRRDVTVTSIREATRTVHASSIPRRFTIKEAAQ